nr:hypothetical protein [Tanacetum cinerariifolium]
MSTDIYAAGSENRPPMLNKENYVPWSSHLLRYDKSRPHGKLIPNSIINGPYVRWMIPEPAVDSCETAQEIWLRVQQMMKGSDIGIQEKKAKLFNEWKRISSNPRNRQIAQPGNLNGYNDVQNVRNQVIHHAVQNPRIQNVVQGNANQNLNGNGNLVVARGKGNVTRHNGNQIRCYNCREVGYFARNYTVRQRRRDAAYLQTQLLISQKKEAGIQLQAEEFDLMAAATDLDEIEEVNANCILMANLQQASASATQTDKAPVYDSDGSAKYTELLEHILEPCQVPQNDNNVIFEDSSMEQSGGTVEQHPANVEKTLAPTEPIDSLSMWDEHLNTILATKSDEFIKSYVENLVPNPSESEGENECDVLACFTTFSNVLFDANYDFDFGDDQSFSDEDVPKKIYSNPLFDEEIIPMEIDPHSFNAESDLIESMPNTDSSITISLKIDSLFDEFAGELTLLTSIPPGINEADCHLEKEICLAKRLLYDNSSPRPLEEIVFDNSNADIESFSPSPIPNLDSDSHIEEIDLSFNPDDPMPPGIEDDDYDSRRDTSILEELLDNYSLSPAKPPDGNIRTLNIKMMGDISD